MGRTGPVIRAGLVARAGHGGSTVTAAAVVAAVLLAGCGTRPAGPPARGRPTPAAAISTGPGGGGFLRQARVPRPWRWPRAGLA
jgi:hypothetical protein